MHIIVSEERPSWVRVVEEWIDELKSRVDALEKRIDELYKKIADIFELHSELVDVFSATRALLVITLSTPVSLNVIEDGIKRWKEFADSYRKHLGKVPWPTIQVGIGMILAAAKVSNIDFDHVAAILIEIFGQDARHVVKIEDVIKFYGIENADKWKRLIKAS